MRRSLIATAVSLSLSLAMATALAVPGPTTAESGQPMVAKYIPVPKGDQPQVKSDQPQPPLNEYGAVDVNAKVPYAEQVPPKPKGFKDPDVTSIAQKWNELIPSQPTLNVRSYILMAPNSGQILADYNPNQREAPASLTKLMLLYVAAQELANNTIHLTDEVRVPVVAWATGGSRMFLKPNTTVTVQKLINGIVVPSGNDAAVTLATYIAGNQSAFVSMMNQQAQRLGMTNTHFTDVMGLPAPDHYTSARDLGVLADHIIEDYPQYLDWYNQKYFSYNGITQPNFNKLLFIYKDAIGMKTGSTNEAGYSLVGAAKEPDNPMYLVSVVMGAPSSNASAADSKALLTYGYRFFKDKELYAADKTIQNARVYMGAEKYLPVGVAKNLWITIPRNGEDKLSAALQLKKGLSAPITQGEQVGRIVVDLDGKQLTSAPAIALKADAKGGWFRRVYDTVAGWF